MASNWSSTVSGRIGNSADNLTDHRLLATSSGENATLPMTLANFSDFNVTSVSDVANATGAWTADAMLLDARWPYAVLAMVLVIVLTVLGNALVIVTIICQERLHRTVYYILASLATCDILVALLIMPFSVVRTVTDWLALWSAWCEGWQSVWTVLLAAGLLHLAMAVCDCHVALLNPLKYQFRKVHTYAILNIGLTWAAGGVLAVPFIIVLKVFPQAQRAQLVDEGCGLLQIEHTLTQFLVAFLAPLVLVAGLWVGAKKDLLGQSRVFEEITADFNSAATSNGDVTGYDQLEGIVHPALASSMSGIVCPQNSPASSFEQEQLQEQEQEPEMVEDKAVSKHANGAVLSIADDDEMKLRDEVLDKKCTNDARVDSVVSQPQEVSSIAANEENGDGPLDNRHASSCDSAGDSTENVEAASDVEASVNDGLAVPPYVTPDNVIDDEEEVEVKHEVVEVDVHSNHSSDDLNTSELSQTDAVMERIRPKCVEHWSLEVLCDDIEAEAFNKSTDPRRQGTQDQNREHVVNGSNDSPPASTAGEGNPEDLRLRSGKAPQQDPSTVTAVSARSGKSMLNEPLDLGGIGIDVTSDRHRLIDLGMLTATQHGDEIHDNLAFNSGDSAAAATPLAESIQVRDNNSSSRLVPEQEEEKEKEEKEKKCQLEISPLGDSSQQQQRETKSCPPTRQTTLKKEQLQRSSSHNPDSNNVQHRSILRHDGSQLGSSSSKQKSVKFASNVTTQVMPHRSSSKRAATAHRLQRRKSPHPRKYASDVNSTKLTEVSASATAITTGSSEPPTANKSLILTSGKPKFDSPYVTHPSKRLAVGDNSPKLLMAAENGTLGPLSLYMANVHRHQSSRLSDRVQRQSNLLTLIMALLWLCLLLHAPYFITRLVLSLSQREVDDLVLVVLEWTCFAASMLKPVLYFALGKDFRDSVTKCCRCKHSSN